jgi:DNA mismatch endonuclease, patch repair protein
MTDKVSPEKRSWMMRRVKNKNTDPEMQVRKLIFAMGYRYRLHVKSLPGSPDIVFSGRKKAIFVHGCFWHMHDCKKGAPPESNKIFWKTKLDKNRERDINNLADLKKNGWKTLVIWQCQLKNLRELETIIKSFLIS